MEVYELIDLLRRKREEIDRTIKILEAEIGIGSETQKTLWDFVQMALEREKAPLSARQITELVLRLGYQTRSKNPTSVVTTGMRSYQQKGLVIRFGKGLWGLPSWKKAAEKKLAKAQTPPK